MNLSPKIEFSLDNVIKSKCQLGEGLYLDTKISSWVDIYKNKLYTYKNNNLETYTLKNKPSVILSIDKNKYTIGCDIGICSYNTVTRDEVLITNYPKNHNFKNFRSNDGVIFGDSTLLGFMHRENPKDNLGFIYSISGKSISVFEEDNFIPNSFIKLSPSNILISDSLRGEIWLYSFNSSSNRFNKKLWTSINNECSPDGGCLIKDLVFIALWDAAAIGVFSLDGKIICKLEVPVQRPTNCKYDPISSQLWITSALDGLSNQQIKTYPKSGDTLIYNLKF